MRSSGVKGSELILHLFILFIPPTVPSKANELLMAVETVQWISLPSLCACFSLPPYIHPSILPSTCSFCALPPPGYLAEPQPPWLRLTSFIVCQQISGDEVGGLVRKIIWTSASTFFFVTHFFLSYLWSFLLL